MNHIAILTSLVCQEHETRLRAEAVVESLQSRVAELEQQIATQQHGVTTLQT